MAKIHKNAEKFPIRWDSTVQGGENQGDSIPSNIDVVWSSNDFTWGDVAFVLEIFDGIGSGARRAREKRLQDLEKEKKKKLIHLICRVKGEETAYDETKKVGDVQLKLDDVDMVISKVTKLNVSGMRGWKEIPWEYNYDE